MEEVIHFKGLLIPVDWYANGKVKAVALATDDEREIAIGGPLRAPMLRYLRQQVDIWGTFADPLENILQVSRLRPAASHK